MPSNSEETKPLTSDRRSSFSFGTEETELAPTTGGFSFGSALPSSTTAEPTTQSGFSFGPSPTATTTETGEFSFGGSTTTFSFGASEPEPSFSLAAATQSTEAINNSSGSSNAVNTESSSEPFSTGGGLFGSAHTGDTDGANTTFGATSSSSTFGVPSLGGSSNPFVAPRFGSSGFASSSEDETHNDLQRKVISLWQQTLGSENITSETDFFEAGGTSMSSISMLSRLGRELGVDLPFLLRENRTVSKLVKYIEEAKRTGFGATSSNTGFGASSSATNNNTPSFGTNSGSSDFGAPRSTGFGSLSFGTNVGTTGFGTAPSSTTATGFGGFGAPSSGTGTTTTSFGFGSTTPAKPFGASQPERLSNSTSVFAPVSLQAFLNNDKADLCLKYGSDQQFLVHSSLMRLMSPIIGEMIDKQKVETIIEGRLVLDIDLKSLYLYKGELEGVLQPERLFKELIENMHGQEVKFNSTSSVTMANIINYYVIASKFGVSTVVNNIRPQIKEKLATVKSDEFEKIVSSAVKNEQEELLWMLNELDEQKCILKVPEWRSVSQEFLLKFIGSDQLRVDNESSVWICVKDWLEGNQLHVMVDEQKVKECVRFPYIAQKDLVQHVKPLSWLTESEYYACLEYRAIDDNNLGDEMKNLISSKFSESMNFKPRDCQKRIDMDVLIVCDTTGSMAGEISVAQATIKNIMSDLKRRCNGTIRFSLIAYKDYCDGPNIIKCHEFTESLTAAKAYVDTMGASGGGDHPEAVALALHHATQAEFRSNAKKYCIIIADAPPHGMGEPGDSMPNGEEHDWLECADKLNQMDVVCYACICGRARDNGNLSLFMDTVARKTTGRCILLQNAEKIPDIIINGTNEDFEIEEVVSDYLKELGDSVKEMSQEDLNTKIQSHFKEKKVQVNTLHVVNCFNSNTQSLASHSKLTSEARSLFGSGTTTVQPSSTAAGFSFGSSSFGAPSESHVSSIASRVTKTYMK